MAESLRPDTCHRYEVLGDCVFDSIEQVREVAETSSVTNTSECKTGRQSSTFATSEYLAERAPPIVCVMM